MSEIDRQLRFANLMDKACTAYQVKRLDKATFELYYSALETYSVNDIEERLDAHILSSGFFPKISDLRPFDRQQHGNQYIAPPVFDSVIAQANRVMTSLIVKCGGVSKPTMKVLIEARDAAVEDFKISEMTDVQFGEQLILLMSGLIRGHEGEKQ